MPWNKVELMSQRKELIEQLLLPGANISECCKQYRISRKTAYKWLKRYQGEGYDGLADRSREPYQSPLKIDTSLEKLIIETHQTYPYWGPRKLRNFLIHQSPADGFPAVSTFARILKRNHCEVIQSSKSAPATKRFERSVPNDLWQMDFKGSFMTQVHRCFPLTLIDDYSRYSIGLYACRNEQGETVKKYLIQCFHSFGQPKQINVDNGNPWGNSAADSHTALAVWLMKHSIRLTHSAPYHPQTNGKDERFHRTLKLEVLHNRQYENCLMVQTAFDQWRHEYNYLRPHDALQGYPPSSRYQPSPIAYTENPLIPDYDSNEIIRKVHNGIFQFKGHRYRAGKGLSGEYIAIKETSQSDEFSIFFIDTFIKKFKLNEGI